MKILKYTALAIAISATYVPTISNAADNKAKKDKGLETILVTAQKRTQSNQEVPISITTIDTDKLDALFSSGDDIIALATKVPGLYAETSNGRVAPRFYIRGIGNTDFDLAASQPVSIIMDDVVMENVVLKGFPLFDLANVEVIRGPQGSLFGRNTTAGIIKFDTMKPSQDDDGYAKISYGTYGTRNFEGAVGGALSDNWSGRVSLLNQHRNDWVNNGYTHVDNAMGGYDESAGRVQLMYQPSDELNVLLNVHARAYNGTSTLFRANILSTGSNQINSNFDRDTVFYDEGNNNPQKYHNQGYSVKINYDMGDKTFTSISAYESATGSSLGDIDGGFGAAFLPVMGPGFIPFNSVTMDNADVDQLTQEFRLASDTDEDYSWQTGLFYFDSNLKVVTSPFFVPPSTVNQSNTTWAVFGQGTYDVAPKSTLVAGVRYTHDKKGLTANSGAGIPINPVNLNDGRVSWELMYNHKLEEDRSVYARVANGFRAQSIQGRDIAFFGQPSVAKSETILSYEAGLKADLMDSRVRINGAAFYYTIKDIQLTAVGGNGNNVGLTNANKGVGKGFEIDSEFLIGDNFNMTAGFSYNDTELRDANLLIPTCGSGQCTPLDPTVTQTSGEVDAYVNGNPFPNAPKTILSVTGRYTIPVESGEFYVYSDYAQQGKTNFFIYRSAEYHVNNQFELGLRLGYENYQDQYEIALYGRNITNEVNLKGGIDFNNNTAFVNEPRIVGIEFKKTFF